MFSMARLVSWPHFHFFIFPRRLEVLSVGALAADTRQGDYVRDRLRSLGHTD